MLNITTLRITTDRRYAAQVLQIECTKQAWHPGYDARQNHVFLLKYMITAYIISPMHGVWCTMQWCKATTAWPHAGSLNVESAEF